MIRPALTSSSFPDWTLERVAASAAAAGFEAVELRTQGPGARMLSCDPALTSERKARSMLQGRGVEAAMLATSLRFDAPILPPVIGRVICDHEGPVRAAKQVIDMAITLECPLVRVFGFELPSYEKRPGGLRRIAERLFRVGDHADKTGVRIAVENGGSFATAAALAELLQEVGHPLVGACYCPAVGAAGGDGEAGVDGVLSVLGSRLWAVRVIELDADGLPAVLGSGRIDHGAWFSGLSAAGFDGPVVYQSVRGLVGQPGGEELDVSAEDELAGAARTMFGWLGAARGRSRPVSGVAAVAGGS